MKRIYKLVSKQETSGGYIIHLDGKPVKTPSGSSLLAPNEDLADALVLEWANQREEILPEDMPLTQILTTSGQEIDRSALEKTVLSYLNTDLLCYRAAQPEAMAKHQKKLWDPWLDWFEKTYGVRLLTTHELKALRQPAEAHEKIKRYVKNLDDLHFAVLQIVTGLSGSLVLALAFLNDAAVPDQVFAALHAEESFKAEIYNEALHGPAPHEEKRREYVMRDLRAAHFILQSMN
jgi:chaperone required for assembly of F1-ATPase